MPKVIAQEVSVLASSKHGLVYLTANDWTLVTDKASRVNFRKGQTLIHRGKKSNGVYLLVKGVARVTNSVASDGSGDWPRRNLWGDVVSG
ncbi:MAG: hypothetical protein WBV55_11715 [Candidatus Sulfotelmatobacter sp.]